MSKVYIGEKVPKTAHVNIYCLTVNSMSGDADHYEDNVMWFTPDKMEDMLKDINLMIGYFKLDHNFCHKEEAMLAEIEKIGKELGLEYPCDDFSGYAGNDVTCEGQYAMPDFMRLTYYGHSGDEFYCGIELDDGRYVQAVGRGTFSGN